MEGVKVLITTSGLGSRLGNITNFTNKSLVRVGDKPAISHIIDSYPKEVKFVITLGHFGKHVLDYIEIAHPDREIEFVFVDKYMGKGSSLGYSIYCAKDNLDCPFVFHACDSIIADKIPVYLDDNWCLGTRKEFTSQYRTLNVNSEKDVVKINEKGEIGFDFSYSGVCKIIEYNKFWKTLESFTFDTSDITDCHVINKMINTSKFKFIETDKWFDIGNTSDLKKTREYFKAKHRVLDKDSESIFFLNNSVVKFFSDKKTLDNRYKRSKILGNLVPETVEKRDNFYKYNFVKGENFADVVNLKSFSEILKWSEKNLWKRQEIEKNLFKKMCHSFYIEKTNKRIRDYLQQNDLKKDKPSMINGECVPSIHTLLERSEKKLLESIVPVSFHGDFILDNIIKTKDGFCLIDWRQEFAGNIETGDLYYDLAKLNHNLVFNHEIVNKGNFNIEIKNDRSEIHCDILRSDNLTKCQSILKRFVAKRGLDDKKINILTSIIWVNMAPLHRYPLSDFLFYFGKYNLHRFLNEGFNDE